ncbi:hypothetical protein EDB83DRAFT_2679263 [Lactarius deliciosus]|nr:hypothetical protein EDB83DRAFT_2679263 [Lactarius deliciosus]
MIDHFHRLPFLPFRCCSFSSTVSLTMPALIPVDDVHGALLIAAVLSSIIYGITGSQVYSYYNSHSSRDRWPLKSFVAFLMLIDTANLVFVIYPTYRLVITNFGDYKFAKFTPWSQAVYPPLFLTFLYSTSTHIGSIVVSLLTVSICETHSSPVGWRSPYLPAAIVCARNLFGADAHSHEQSVISLAEFGIGIMYSTEVLKHIHEPNPFQGVFFATLALKVVCDVLITVGMVYTLLSNRTRVRRTNSVLNLLAIYTVNCGILHLVLAISCVILFAMPPYSLKYTPSLFIMVRLSLCAFMSILNSRDNLRETLDGPGGVVSTFTSSRHARVPISWRRKT